MLSRLDLAYSLNMHMAQGITTDKAITVMSSHERHLSNQRLFNVGVTRVRDELTLIVDDKVKVRLVGDFQSELLADFFDGFARGAKANVHVKTMYGRSNHHKIEAIFKAFARALRGAGA